MKAPSFWWRAPGLRSFLLAPCGAIYGAITARRMARIGLRPPVPILCIGNFVIGGAGKTPTALAIGRLAEKAGYRICFLTRGYGGRLKGPVAVDPSCHSAADVGDEALLLARLAPTVVARERPSALPLVQATGADFCLMDDGLQNSSLQKLLTIAVVDGTVGLGTARPLPAGPLRAPLLKQLPYADAVLILGEGAGALPVIRAAAKAGKPILRAHLRQDLGGLSAGDPVLAYAGLARPEKFFDQLRQSGVNLVETRSFPDHHPFTGLDARELMTRADRLDARLVTTEKDAVRLAHAATGPRAELANRSVVVSAECVFADEDRILNLLKSARALWMRQL